MANRGRMTEPDFLTLLMTAKASVGRGNPLAYPQKKGDGTPYARGVWGVAAWVLAAPQPEQDPAQPVVLPTEGVGPPVSWQAALLRLPGHQRRVR